MLNIEDRLDHDNSRRYACASLRRFAWSERGRDGESQRLSNTNDAIRQTFSTPTLPTNGCRTHSKDTVFGNVNRPFVVRREEGVGREEETLTRFTSAA